METNRRLLSLDTLRGFDMLLIMGLSSFIIAFCKLFPDGSDWWIATQMHHAAWDGFRIFDTIFPLFLFIAGVSFPFSRAKSESKGKGKKDILGKVIWRALMLFLLGLICNGLFGLKFATLRIPSVLGRIGFAWMFAAILYLYVPRKGRIVIAAGILIAYWLVNRLLIAPDAPVGASPFSKEGNIGCWLDRTLLGSHTYKPMYDPEGILGVFPAIVTAMLGMFTGEFVRESKYSGNKQSLIMFGTSAVMLVAGLIWGRIYPVNKALWSSTFVLLAGAYSLGMFALFYWIIDVKGRQGWTPFFKIIGMNSITIYMLPRFFNFSYCNKFVFGGIADLLPEAIGPVFLAATYIMVGWFILLFLYKHKIFLKI